MLQLKRRGWRQRDIAEALGASEVSVSRWLSRARESGPEAILSRPAPGHPPKLSPAQKRLIPEFLWHGAEAYGFRGQVWTCARVAQVIEEEFGVSYHRDHVGRVLRELHWTPQMPIKRKDQRGEEAIRHWRDEVWPELRRQATRERRTLVFEDESGFYLLPGLVQTYAPEGDTPVIREKQTRDHLSVMGGMTPEGKVDTLVRQESLNGMHTVRFLAHLRKVAGDRLLVIWDGSPIHRRKAVQEFVARIEGAGGTAEGDHVPAAPGRPSPPAAAGWPVGGATLVTRREMQRNGSTVLPAVPSRAQRPAGGVRSPQVPDDNGLRDVAMGRSSRLSGRLVKTSYSIGR